MSAVGTDLIAVGLGTGGASPDVTPGTVVAWAVRFYVDRPGQQPALARTIGSDSYDGTVTATLPYGLSGGTYSIVVEGLTDDDYTKITRPAGGRLAATLHLWWKDNPSSVLGDLARVTGLDEPLGPMTPDPPPGSLVAWLRIDSVQRKAGERRYETVFTGHERAIARLDETRVSGACYADLDAVARGLGSAAGTTVTGHDLTSVLPAKNQPEFATVDAGSALRAAQTLVEQAAAVLRLHGQPSAVIRDGAVHVGRWTGIGARRTVDEARGLVSVERGQPRDRDAAAGDRPDAPPSRESVTITALGRPDIKPGDVVSVVLPDLDFPSSEPPSFLAAALPLFASAPIADDAAEGQPHRCLVGEVSHRVSRRQGFVTTLRATVLGDPPDDGWDPPAVQPAPRTAPAPPQPSADPASGAAAAVQAVFRSALDADGGRPRVAMIHDHTTSGVPRHSSDVWYADDSPDGRPAGVRRARITEDDHGEAQEVPYLTPFGWGNYGLVLPRYPGTRVLAIDTGQGAADLVDIGALWARDGGPSAQPGDYWLVLPVGITAREHLADDGDAPDGPASHDLIDADGTRVIETTRFVVTVTDSPTDCTSRPTGDDTPEHTVLIRTKTGSGGASIQLTDDGTVTVIGSSIVLDTQGQGDISLSGNNVKVKVTGTMDVS